MEQGNETVRATQNNGDMVSASGPGIRLDLNGKISRYLDSLSCSAWPMRVWYLNRPQEREEAEVWIKELIGRVLNA